MAEFTCPGCGNYFQGTACASCVGKVRGYVCAKCGARIENPLWNGVGVEVWLKSNRVNE